MAIPHLSLPFQVVNGAAVTVEQDSDQELIQCVEVICIYRPGDRQAAPDFGVPDQSHQQGGADLVTIAERIELWDPRVREQVKSLGFEDTQHMAQHVMINTGRRNA